MTRLSVLEDAKVKIAAYDHMSMYDCWSDKIVHELIETIKGLVAELEETHMHLNAQEWEQEDWKDYE